MAASGNGSQKMEVARGGLHPALQRTGWYRAIYGSRISNMVSSSVFEMPRDRMTPMIDFERNFGRCCSFIGKVAGQCICLWGRRMGPRQKMEQKQEFSIQSLKVGPGFTLESYPVFFETGSSCESRWTLDEGFTRQGSLHLLRQWSCNESAYVVRASKLVK